MYYFIAPLLAWVVAGCLKFTINFIKHGNEAKSRIGYGGFPSTHTTVITTTTALIGLGEGIRSAEFGLAVAVTLIIIIDATGLRRQVGNHAKYINLLLPSLSNNKCEGKLRESMGHNFIEVLGGVIVGISLALVLNILLIMMQ